MTTTTTDPHASQVVEHRPGHRTRITIPLTSVAQAAVPAQLAQQLTDRRIHITTDRRPDPPHPGLITITCRGPRADNVLQAWAAWLDGDRRIDDLIDRLANLPLRP